MAVSTALGRAPTVGIVGGGVAGLTAAYRLLQRGLRVRVLEAGPTLGGLVQTIEVGGEPIERFYHHLFKTDDAAVRLITELGLDHRLEWYASRIGVFHDGRVYPFVTPIDLLRFTPLSLRDRIRLGRVGMRLRGQADGTAYESTAAADWLRASVGERSLEVVWAPLLRGKFGEMADRVVMTWLWNKIHLRFSSRNGGLFQREVLGYLRGSFGALIESLVQRVRALGGDVSTGRPVRRIEPRSGSIALVLDGETAEFDAVVATVGNSVLRRIAPDLPATYTAPLDAIPYQDALCLLLALKRPLTGMYWLNISDPSLPFVAAIEHTNLVGAERYGGRHIVYLSNYVRPDSPLLEKRTGDLCGLYLPHLRRINPEFEEHWILDRWLFHGRDAQPVFTVGAAGRIPAHRTPVEGLYVANMAQVYPQDRGQNYSILLGEKVAAIVESEVSRVPAVAR
jgi:protoporphyrinogen oxidase